METQINEKFYAGDVVTLKQADILENVPNMLSLGLERSGYKFKPNKGLEDGDIYEDKVIHGIGCLWFDKNQVLHKHPFDFKDLKMVAKSSSFNKKSPRPEGGRTD